MCAHVYTHATGGVLHPAPCTGRARMLCRASLQPCPAPRALCSHRSARARPAPRYVPSALHICIYIYIYIYSRNQLHSLVCANVFVLRLYVCMYACMHACLSAASCASLAVTSLPDSIACAGIHVCFWFAYTYACLYAFIHFVHRHVRFCGRGAGFSPAGLYLRICVCMCACAHISMASSGRHALTHHARSPCGAVTPVRVLIGCARHHRQRRRSAGMAAESRSTRQ